MSAQDDYVKENLNILREVRLSGMDDEAYLAWQTKIDDVARRYQVARDREKDDKRAQEIADAIAKAAPEITKSVISAVKAFSNGDAVNGSADVMDICASAAPLISTFLNAAGPGGALVGALFSVIGQILRCFGPKEESDVSKLEKFLNEMQAQDKLENIKAVHDEVLTHATTLLKEAASLEKLLAQPLRTDDDFQTFYIGLKKSNIILSNTSPHDSVSSFKQWDVLQYLQAPEHQDVALWPTVLGIFCKTYSDLVSSAMTITAMANTDDMQARLADVRPVSTPAKCPNCGAPLGHLFPGDLSPNDLSPAHRLELEKDLLNIKAYAEARKLEYQSCNEHMLQALKKLTGAAQRWGLYGCIWTDHALNFTSGPTNVKNGNWTNLSDRNYYHRLMLLPDAATTIRDGQVSSQFNFKPDYHCLVLKSTGYDYPGSHHWVDHLWLNTDRMAITSARNILDNWTPAFTDIWAAGENEKGLDIFAGTAEVRGAPGTVTRWGLGAQDGYNAALLQPVDWSSWASSAVGTTRAVLDPISALGDPDEAEIARHGRAVIVYASMRESNQVYVNTKNEDHYIPVPAGWGHYTGVTVDQSYLWLYHTFGFAVVSHASVLSYLRGVPAAPRWMRYPSLPPDLLGQTSDLDGMDHKDAQFIYNGFGVLARPPLQGLISLSPCEDGTLVAAVVHRTVHKKQYEERTYEVNDEWTIQTAPYEIDIVKGTVSPGSWTKIPGEALHVQKLPMPGWALFSSLIAKLS
jgi:hypothetical protein